MSNPQQGANAREVSEARKRAGAYLKGLRQNAGLTQRELAEKVGIAYYTFITQIEAGKGRVPPHAYPDWARALNVDVVEFAWELMRFYDPDVYNIVRVDRRSHAERNE